MAEFKVSIYERMIHTIVISADDQELAIKKAYEVISNVPEVLMHTFDYEVDGEYMGVHEAEELPAD